MILRGARLALGPNRAAQLDITIRGGRIASLGRARGGIDLDGYMILPGLVNAHDHLSFNLFPLLGNPPYKNATEWARDIYHPDESPIREHRSVPRKVRIAWGAIKNLISGVTTVAHHDPDPPSLTKGLPIRVAKAAWAHSIDFTPDLARRARGKRAFIIHAGEGTDAAARDEVFTLDRMGVLNDRAVLVHGVAIDAHGLRLIQQRRASMIACPVSNLYTLRRTLKRSVFSTGIPIALGTDSALTAPGDLLDVLRAAQSIWRLGSVRLYSMVTKTAAEILKIDAGEIREGGLADLIVVSDAGTTPAETLLNLRRVEIVIVGGEVRLVSQRFKHLVDSSFETLAVRGRGRFLIDAPIAKMYQETAARVGAAFRLAGRPLRIK